MIAIQALNFVSFGSSISSKGWQRFATPSLPLLVYPRFSQFLQYEIEEPKRKHIGEVSDHVADGECSKNSVS